MGSQHKAMRRLLLTRRLSSASTRGFGKQRPFVLDEESLVFAVGIVRTFREDKGQPQILDGQRGRIVVVIVSEPG